MEAGLKYLYRNIFPSKSNQPIESSHTRYPFSHPLLCGRGHVQVPAQLFIINGYLCEIQSVIHVPSFTLTDEAQFYSELFTLG